MTNPKILIVEDDVDLQRGLMRRLQASGYEVVLAGDGLAAISTARTERPDLILLDIGLPAGDGYSVLERYSHLASLWTIPVVILTGRDRSIVEPKVRAFDVAGFLSKPADNDELLRVVKRALAGEPDPEASGAPAERLS